MSAYFVKVVVEAILASALRYVCIYNIFYWFVFDLFLFFDFSILKYFWLINIRWAFLVALLYLRCHLVGPFQILLGGS